MKENIKREQIIDRIQKLMNMNSSNGAFEGEISNAAALIQRLMDKYTISEEEIKMKASEADQKAAEDAFNSGASTVAASSILPWHWILAKVIGKITHTKHYVSYGKGKGVNGKEKWGKQMNFFGTKDNIEIASMLYDLWIVNIMSMAAKAMTEWCHELIEMYPEQYDDIARRGLKQRNYQFKDIPHSHMPFVFKASWINNCVAAMLETVINEESERAQKSSMALAIYDDKVAAAYREYSGSFKTVRSRGPKNFSVEGAIRGRQIGRNLRISKQFIEE